MFQDGTYMGQYSVIGIAPDCKFGALCGCWFKSNLAHQSLNTRGNEDQNPMTKGGALMVLDASQMSLSFNYSRALMAPIVFSNDEDVLRQWQLLLSCRYLRV